MNQFLSAPEYSIGTVLIFFENSRRYSQVKVHYLYQRHRRQICHQSQRHRWQIMRTVSGCRHLKVNLKAKIYIYDYSTTQRSPNKIIKIFLFEDFCHLPPVSTTPVVHLELRISRCQGSVPVSTTLGAANISTNFQKHSKRPYWYTQGLGEPA
jgi:hypothetical protein